MIHRTKQRWVSPSVRNSSINLLKGAMLNSFILFTSWQSFGYSTRIPEVMSLLVVLNVFDTVKKFNLKYQSLGFFRSIIS